MPHEHDDPINPETVVTVRIAQPRVEDWDEVDQASADSFPASDPPAWISRHPRFKP